MHEIKNSLALILIGCITISANAQNGSANGQQNNQWKINGNSTDTNHFIGTTNDRDLKFKTNNVEYLRITKEGNIGIGTKTPITKLDVNGALRLSNGELILNNLAQPTLSTNELLLIDNNGVVGRATPEKLNTIIYATPLPEVPAPCANGFTYTPIWGNSGSNLFVQNPNCINNLRVGIGTTMPLHTLDVRGKAFMSEGILVGTYSTAGYSNSALFEGIRQLNNNSPLMRFSVRKTDGTNEVRFKVEGDGTVYCTSVKVRLSNTIPIPDFVFKPGYKLMSLVELKEYVSQNSHLPEIPNEKEIREEGLTVDEFQLKLLQKIEELTLYLIVLDEKNQVQAEENATLKAEIELLKVQINLK